MKLTIVTTLYLSESYINQFYKRLLNTITNLNIVNYEIIFVDDCSPDDSLNLACEIAKKDNKVRVIELSRNFGHHKAIMTGLKNASGDKIFLIDSDLEEKPEYLKNFITAMNENDSDVVFGVQDKRKGKRFERLTGKIFWKSLKKITGLPFKENQSTIRLMKKSYVDALTLHNEHELFIAGLWLITGFKQDPISISKSYRNKSTYSFNLKVSLFINSITSFSNKPLIGIFYVGLIIFLSSLLYSSYLIYSKLFLMQSLPGWTSVMASLWFLGGLTISFIGIIGIYLSKIFIETKNRPYSIIKKIHEYK